MPEADLSALLRTLQPVLHDGVYVYVEVPHDSDVRDFAPLATFREDESLTLILEEQRARSAGLTPLFRAAWITLTVHSDLAAAGLTAAFSRVLADVGISCNVVAAARHDHLFVPLERAAEALARLRALQESARA